MDKKNNKAQLRYGIVLSYAQMAVSIMMGLAYTPVMIQKLGQSEYGLYTTSASVISMLSILSLGFGSGYVRFFARYKASDDQKSISKLNGLFLVVFSIIGVIALAIGLFLTFNLHMVYDQGLTDQEYSIARVLMLLLTINLSLSFPMSVFVTIIAANERFIFQKVVNMGKTVLTPLMTLPLLLCGLKSIAVVSVNVGMALIVDIICIIYVVRVLKQRFIFKEIDRKLFTSLFAFTSFILINVLIRQVNWNVDKVILGRVQGTGAVAVYGVASTLHTYFENFSTSVSGVFRTRVHMIVNTTELDSPEQRRQLTDIFTKVGRIQFLILGLIASGLVFFGYDFIVKYWVGEGYEESYFVCLLLTLPAFVALIQNVGVDVQRALNRHKFRSLVYIGMCVVNVILTVYLSKRYGATGAAAGTAVSLILVDGVVLNIYYHFRCNIDIIQYWKEILKCAVGVVPPVLCGIWITRSFPANSVGRFLLEIACYTVCYCVSIWFLSLKGAERRSISNKVRGVIKR